MKVLLLIVERRGMRTANSPETARRLYDEMMAYRQELQESGRLLASESLLADDRGVRVAAPDGKMELRDGPFTEAREMVGGFFLVDVPTFDDAVGLARRCPAARWASVEIRQCGPCHVR